MVEMVTASFTLRVEGKLHAFTVSVPSHPITLGELLPALFEFNRQLLAHAIDAEHAAGHSISCRAGCGACCRQLVPISSIEASIIRNWVDSSAPDVADGIRSRFNEAVASLKAANLHERLTNRDTLSTNSDMRALGVDYFRAGVACPFLVDESCSIYEVRPMKCREYLVTSPPARCAEPTPEGVRMLRLPRSFLNILLQMQQRFMQRESAWFPLTFLYEGVDENPQDAAIRVPGPELLESFVAEFATG